MKNCCSVFANVKKTVYLSSEVIKLSFKRLDKFCIIVDKAEIVCDMEEEKKRKREIIILKLTIVILSAALLVQVLFGREGLLRKSSEVIRALSVEKAANDRGADSVYVKGDTVWLYKDKEFIGTAVFEIIE